MEVKHKTGITFGAFDPVHIGHIFLIENALKHCDRLIVGLSSDDYIREVKGYTPMFCYDKRKTALYMVKGVTEVVKQCVLEGFTKKDWVDTIKPDLLFVGSDWTPETYTGEGLGVPVIYLPRTEIISASLLRTKNL